MSNKQGVTVKILDREYKFACEPEERRQLLDAADYLDGQMRMIKEGSNMVGMEKIAVLAALNITNDFLAMKERDEVIGRTVGSLRKKLTAALAEEGEKTS